MLKSYEAVYSHGYLRWVHQTPPDIAKEMRVIVVLDAAQYYQEEHDRERIHVLLQRTRGALGRGKTLQEIDQEIQTVRKEWEREWET